MKRLKFFSNSSLLGILLTSNMALAAPATTCLMQEDGGCRINVSVLVSSEYFDSSNKTVTLPPILRETSDDEVYVDDFPRGLEPFNPDLISKTKARTYIERALKSFRDQCDDTMKAYRLKETKASVSIQVQKSDFCQDFKKVGFNKNGDVLRASSPFPIVVPPETYIHYITLKAPYSKNSRYESMVTRSSFHRACSLLNARLLSHDQVYFSYCRDVSGYQLLSNENGTRETTNKTLIVFTKPEFDPQSLSVLPMGTLSRESLEDPGFLLPGTKTDFIPIWQPPFEGGQRMDLSVEYDDQSSTPILVKDLEQQKRDAEGPRNPYTEFVEDKVIPAIDAFNAFNRWLDKKQKQKAKD